MNPKAIISLYRSILRQSKKNYHDIDLSKGILTFRDSKYCKTIFVDKYCLEKHDIYSVISGPYQSKPMNVISWIKNQIREEQCTKKNIDMLFEVHRDLGEILTIAEYETVIRYEY